MMATTFSKAFSDGILNLQHSKMESRESFQFDLWHSEMESMVIFLSVSYKAF